MIKKGCLKNSNIAIIGAGISGVSLAVLARKCGANVFVSDSNKIKTEHKDLFASQGIDWEENGNTERLLNYSEIVVSSGISPQNEMLQMASRNGITITGEIDFVCPFLTGEIIAVTGSNGKTTVTSMLGYFLEKTGHSVAVCGNIGKPIAEIAEGNYSFIVIELSSFQLYWAKKFHCHAAIVTNLAPDHIDWHGSYKNYLASKTKLVKLLDEAGFLICQKNDLDILKIKDGLNYIPLFWDAQEKRISGIFLDSKECTAWLRGFKNDKSKMLFNFKNIKLLGVHNLMNLAMALSLLELYDITIPEKVISLYTPPEHRCSYVGEVKSITFVDDSKGTNVAATVTALTALKGTKVVILGGQGKGESYIALAEAVKIHARHAVLIGAEKENIAESLLLVGFKAFSVVNTMQEAVETAYSKSSPGDIVLLSPACTSWDMYTDYKARGKDFCEKVKNVIEREEE